MPRKERLPRYVASFVDNRGKRRYRFRKAGCEGGYFQNHPNSEAGKEEYHAFLSGEKAKEGERRRIIPGSVEDLLVRFYASTDFRGRAQEVSLAKRRAVLDAFRAKHGHRMVRDARYDKLDKYIAEVAVQRIDEKGKKIGGPFAAETARKWLTKLFAYAVKLGWRADNPMAFVDYRPPKSDGFYSWTEGDIAKYRARWPLGTKQRLALELMLWTGKRRSDAVLMGPQHIERGELAGRDKKTGKRWSLPIAAQLQTALDAMGKGNHLCFVPSERGRAYTAASFGNQFKRWCKQAGLPQCTSHGLRKAISRRMAELDIGNQGIKSVTLHSRDEEVTRYTAGADQKRLARDAIGKVSEWEVSSAKEDARQSAQKRAAK